MPSKTGAFGYPSSNGGDEEAFNFAINLIAMVNVPRALNTVLRLGLLQIISESGRPMSAMDIVAHIPTKHPEAAAMMVDRILGFLATYGVVTCSLKEVNDNKPRRVYCVPPLSKFLVRNDDGVSLANLCYLNWEDTFAPAWNHLPNAILEGGVPFNKAYYGKNLYDYLSENQKLSELFNMGMWEHTNIVLKRIINTYDGFNGLETIVDVGGGTGGLLNLIITKYPTIKGINFDLPHVIAEAATYPGIEHVGGDMFIDIPKGDAIIMKLISHTWEDESFKKILKNSYNALPKSGKVVLIDPILPQLPDAKKDKYPVYIDCTMLIHTPAGRERTFEEFEQLARDVGFKGFQVITKVYGMAVMELLK